jgi:flagellar biosynthetic protein FlhB
VSEGSLDPTPKRLERARREGDFGGSGALGGALALVVASFALPAFARALEAATRLTLKAVLASASAESPSVALDGAGPLSARSLVAEVLVLAGPMVALVAAVAALTTLVETGFGIAPARLLGKGRNSSGFSVSGFVKSILVAVVAVPLVALALRASSGGLVHMAGRSPSDVLAHSAELVAWVVRTGIVLVGIVAGIDAWHARSAHRARLRMTPREVEDERKQGEGDPEVKAARKRAAETLTSETPLARLEADHTACVWEHAVTVVLAWNVAEDPAPRVVAKAKGEAANLLRREAASCSIGEHYAPGLTLALFETATGRAVAERHYEEVADLFAQPARSSRS